MEALASRRDVVVSTKGNVTIAQEFLEKVTLLPDPDRDIMQTYFGLFDRPQKTLEEISEQYGKSRQEILTRIQLSLDRMTFM